jgi:hypothetical protein
LPRDRGRASESGGATTARRPSCYEELDHAGGLERLGVRAAEAGDALVRRPDGDEHPSRRLVALERVRRRSGEGPHHTSKGVAPDATTSGSFVPSAAAASPTARSTPLISVPEPVARTATWLRRTS